MSADLSPTLIQLRDHAGHLHALLSDPHPSILMWTAAVAHEWQQIADLGDHQCQQPVRPEPAIASVAQPLSL
jgi:hypothetical protein